MAAPTTPAGGAKPGVVAMLKAEYERLRETYDQQNKYWKWKSWIIGAYLVVAGTSVVLAIPPLNTLGAVVSVSPITIGFDRQYAAMVRNESGGDWSGVTITFSGRGGNRQVFERPRVPANEWFQTPGVTWVPNKVEIEADQGSFSLRVANQE